MSRTKEAIKNYIVVSAVEVITLVVGLISRALFVRTIGVYYLGVTGLFSGILGILALGNLGIGDAFVYVMIRTFARGKREDLYGIYNFSKKAYIIIILVLMALASGMLPFLNFFIKEGANVRDIYIYYCIFVFSTLLSYVKGPYEAIYKADQKYRMIKKSELMGYLFSSIMQMISLVLFSNYTIYLVLQLLNGIVSVIYIRHKFKLDYEDIYLSKEKIRPEERKLVFNRVKDTFVVKLSGTAVESTDKMLISRFLGVTTLGRYDNYLNIINNIRLIAKNLYYSLESGVGTISVVSDKKRLHDLYQKELIGYHIIATVLTSCVYSLMQDFIGIWIGNEHLLSDRMLLIICMDLYLNILFYAQAFSINTTHIYGEFKRINFVGAVINVALSIILGIMHGLEGIVGATLISRALWTYPIGLFVLYKKLFEESFYRGAFKNLLYYIQAFAVIGVINVGANKIIVDSLFLWVFKGIIVFGVSGILIVLLNIKNKDLNSFKKRIISFIKNKE